VLFNNAGVIEGSDGLRYFDLTTSLTLGSGTIASGFQAFSGGDTSISDGTNAFSYGDRCNASGTDSFSIGDRTTSSGDSSFSGGTLSTATGTNAFAYGSNADATADNAVSIGADSSASGQNCASFGSGASCSALHSTALAKAIITSGSGSAAIAAVHPSDTQMSFSGVGLLHLYGFGAQGTGSYDAVRVYAGPNGAVKSIFTEEHGTAISWAYVAINDTNWLTISGVIPTNLGEASDILADVIANNITIDPNSFSSDTQVIFNNGGVLDGDAGLEYFVSTASLTIGSGNIASGTNSIAGGANSIATGDNAFAYGSQCNASGARSFSIGILTDATGNNAFAGGNAASASGTSSFAYGLNAMADNDNCVAIGANADSSGFSSTAIGAAASVNGNTQMAIGKITLSSGSGGIGIGAVHPSDTTMSIASSTGRVHIYGFGTQTTGSYDSVRVYAGPNGDVKSIFTQEHGTAISWAYVPSTPSDWVTLAGSAPTNLGEASDFLADAVVNNVANTNDTQILFNDGGVLSGDDLLRFEGTNFLYGNGASATGDNSFVAGYEASSFGENQMIIGRVNVTFGSGGLTLAACLRQNDMASFTNSESMKFWSRNGGTYDNSFTFFAGQASSLRSMRIVNHVTDLTPSYTPTNSGDFSGPVSNVGQALDDTASTLTDHVEDMANPHNVTIDQVSPTTTLGDIMVDDGTNVVRLPLGNDNFQVMFSNLSSPTGIEWGFVDSFYVLFNMPSTWTDWWPGVVGTFISTAFQNLSQYLSDHVLQQGTFTPTFTDISGTSARAAGDVVYSCIGEVCTVAMRCDFTLTATTFSVDIDTSSLPITNVFSCSGTGSAGTGSLTNAHVNDAGGACRISGRAESTGAVSFFITFMYR
jgi:hypothetical protein